MNRDSLLAHYERIADSPDAIARLRCFILNLAVRGKLVPQDPNDEPATVLLTRIAKEKVRIGVEHSVLPLGEGEIPFDLPIGWSWSRIGELCSKTGSGSTPRGGKEVYKASGVPFLRSQNIYNDGLRLDDVAYIDQETHSRMSGTKVLPRDLLLNITGGSIGRCCRIPDDFKEANVSQHVAIIRTAAHGTENFLHRLILSSYFQAFVVGEQTGAGRGGLPKNRMDRIAVALPPLSEQFRIVAKVDELMQLCDRLEAARVSREAVRDRLAAASLARLNAPDPETFQADARFVLDALPALTSRPDQIKQLRQTILNLAVRGKLVPQDLKDEPAAQLLKRTAPLTKPARYEKRSPELIPGDCGLSINDPGTELPKGWLWVPLVKIARLESGHTPSRNRPDWWGGDVPWIGLVDARLHSNGTIFKTIQTTNEQGLANSAARLLPKGTVCFSRTASVGYVVIMGRAMATSQDFVNWVPTDAISSSWLQLVMIAERPAIGRFSKGAVHQTIYYPAWLSMHIALPPLAEQHRIVAKVDELMAMCDRLEAGLTDAADTRRCLLDALLAEALEPTAEALEAAE
jgi:type I restriction enzyme S subunit